MKTAIVVGAGIGGVTAAVALERCGWQVTVLERAPELGEVGAGLSVWPSAVAVLEELGVTGVEKSSVPAGMAGMRWPGGGWVVEASALGVEIPVMIHRAQLHDLITARFGAGVTVRTGTTITGISQTADEVTVVAGDEEFRADLVVAADGIRSVVRSTLHPAYEGPRYAGYTAYRGIAEVDGDDGGGETWGRGRRFGYARLIDGRIYWYATANQPAGTPPGPDGRKADALKLFGDWHEPIPSLLAATPEDQVLQNDLYDLAAPLVPFVTGRIALLGDAAHAMTPNLGRGACSAIEDAGALARHLTPLPAATPSAGELAEALARYDAERRPVTAKLVQRSRAIGRVGQMQNPLAGAIRDSLLVLGGKVAALRKH
ncbi:2-polyprenyl-6-methoxyphenol hydroxylase-like FAD-dependent oxidoreductase [Kribbella amoyensis]|uniref:2-polyprenyl-6-methoxyphenol hydroxylase-like FAD-dependent oxidoreductase n=1 Tax=Kribbella amoyensis TaxID=996641 RepID=A0A561BMK8_9ACTN|nr:FAD-dependent monooxygenase [Kribbella amoyensis]TWD80121.1 2-polyprenyl-6-methoxyphenol hydroxylase-like FAD-dependent oxidoreductase [Kribbella amoyensis]